MKSLSLFCAALLLGACGGGTTKTDLPATKELPPAPAETRPAVTPAAGVALAPEKIIEPPMVSIPSGTFAWANTARTISIQAFQLSKYEVTVGQYRQFVKATGYRSANDTCWKLANTNARIEYGWHTWDAQVFEQNEFHPVACVSDIDAKAYMRWLEQNTGKAYRLPSEAEWEYAYRGGSAAPWWGDATTICRYANVRDTTGIKVIGPLTSTQEHLPCSDGAVFTTVVGMYQPNPFGLYDMVGNLNEIFDDCEHGGYANAPADGAVWNTGCSSDTKKRRGGPYDQGYLPPGPGFVGHYGTGNHASMEGFRIALRAPATPESQATRDFEAALAQARVVERQRMAAAAK